MGIQPDLILTRLLRIIARIAKIEVNSLALSLKIIDSYARSGSNLVS